ncbi:hypothetical protein AOL_s00076g85 [Orbilia oligospora ATCC 24927]|uniref:BTB domain-containing protein n=1 Tax=Arthrobotrys oligospora (strain ATCC 24927 / CBS 115.81 / DSM 1491) TaxID=756982 RepID=G1X8X8_ARTOA|nr:hypothetical protein AOL_s00076g85 [Orbilia oligospora ATCC 24927]EGX50321.1 hypothetical protein AOL_s00076g85 [Orbilia oligospora ATCC 24927]
MAIDQETPSEHIIVEPPSKRLKSEMQGETSPAPTPSEYGLLLGKLWDPEFSDVTVYVGTGRQEYKLHRTIICAESEYLRKACKAMKPGGSPHRVELRNIKPAAFDVILKWIYGCGYSVPEDYEPSKFLDTYTAADHLCIHSLKEEIMHQITTTIQMDVVKNKATHDCTIQNPIHLMWRFAQVSTSKDFDVLQKPVKQFLALRGVNTEWVKGMASVKDNHNLFNENSTFSDVTVIIGEEAKVFKLHRIILAANSDYFVGALNEAFTEGKSRQITIPHINSDVFKRVIEYFYTRSLGFTDEDPLDWDLITALYQAADYLLAPILKQEVTLYLAKKIVDFNFAKYIEKNPEAEGKSEYDIMLEGLGNVFEHSTMSDWNNIKLCTDCVEWRDFPVSPNSYPNFVAQGKNTTILLAALFESFREI